MLTPIKLDQLIRNDVTAIADTSMAHTLALFARVLQARNPLVTAPPAESIVWQNAGNVSAAADLMHTLNRAVVDPFFLRLGKKEESSGEQGLSVTSDPKYQPWLIASSNLGLSGLLSFPRVYANSLPVIKDALNALSDENNQHLGTMLNASLSELLEKDGIRVPFTQLALTMAYEQIIKSGVFDKISPPDNTGERSQYTILERGLLLSTMLRMLSIQTTLLKIRPVLRYLRMEQPRTRLREEMMPSHLEYWEAIIDRILNVPVHPWVARAEQTALPANRVTPWGDSTPTVLLERTFLSSPWDGRGAPSPEERNEYAEKMSQLLDAPVLMEAVQPLLKELRRFFDEIEEGGRFTKLAGVLGFTTPGGPIPVPLWGMAFKPVFMDGLNATESVSDLIAASFNIHLPAQGRKLSPWIGDDQWEWYLGADRANSQSSMWSEYVGSVCVAPEDVVVDDAFYSGRFSPAMFKFKDEAFLGDISALPFPATQIGVASIIGRTEKDLAALVIASPRQWAHIFTVVSSASGSPAGIKPVRPDGQLFYSDRTRMTWLTTIPLPRQGVPTVMWAMRRGKPETAMPTRARFLRDRAIPTATVPLAGAIDKLQQDSISARLTGVKG